MPASFFLLCGPSLVPAFPVLLHKPVDCILFLPFGEPGIAAVRFVRTAAFVLSGGTVCCQVKDTASSMRIMISITFYFSVFFFLYPQSECRFQGWIPGGMKLNAQVRAVLQMMAESGKQPGSPVMMVPFLPFGESGLSAGAAAGTAAGPVNEEYQNDPDDDFHNVLLFCFCQLLSVLSFYSPY